MYELWIALLASIPGIIAAIAAAWVTVIKARTITAKQDQQEVKQNEQATAQTAIRSTVRTVANAVADVKATVVENKASTDDKLDAVHSLVNNQMSSLLKANAVAMRKLASLPDATQADKIAADNAEDKSTQYDAKQEIVDEDKKIDPLATK